MNLLPKLPVSPQRTFSLVPTAFLFSLTFLVIPTCPKHASRPLTALDDHVHNIESLQKKERKKDLALREIIAVCYKIHLYGNVMAERKNA